MNSILEGFQLSGNVVSFKEFGSGHINTTIKVITDDGHTYILQKINHHVFKNPIQVMENAVAVTKHLHAKDPDPRHTLHFLETTQGGYCYRDPEGNYWRLYDFVPGVALDAPEYPEDLFSAGLGFGKFQQSLLDFPAHTLKQSPVSTTPSTATPFWNRS